MPRNTREWAKRKLQQAVENIDWTGTHLEDVRKVYKPDHPEIASPIQNIQDVLTILQAGIEKVRSSF